MKQLACACMLLMASIGYAQTLITDSLALDLLEAKKLLVQQNLSLIAARYDVSAADAELIQARLWNNPNFVWNQDLYSNEQNKYFNVNNQRLVQVEQIFSIAGKHTNTVKLARLGVELSKLQVQEVLRSLFFELGEHFYALQSAQQKQQLYESAVARYDQLIKSAEERLRVGAMASNEVLRLISEQLAVRAEAAQNKNEVLAKLSEVRVLLNLSERVYVKVKDANITTANPTLVGELVDQALNSRSDFLLKQKQISYEAQNLKLQRSSAYPDLNIAYQPHDKGSNYVRPYQGVNLEFNLPVFNRNQGNIKLAKVRVAQAETIAAQVENTIRNEVTSSYEQYLNSKAGFEGYSQEILLATEQLNTNANSNYAKKNINLLEYIDLERIYIINKTQYIDLRNAYYRAANQLNFAVGLEIVY